MTCNRCRHPMKELRGTHHGNRKWQCPQCGKVRMQQARDRDKAR
jgi:transposase-like protein